MSGATASPIESAKLRYTAPILTLYGSVRDLTGGDSGTVPDSPNGKTPASDPRYKENVVRVGDHPLGFGVYLFDYKAQFRNFGEGRQFGVMADEVERIVPEAVLVDRDGYRRVDYEMLGITRH